MAASTLPERPRFVIGQMIQNRYAVTFLSPLLPYRSPNHYARQRTMVVMETVRAATQASARRMERLKAEAEKQRTSTEATQVKDGTSTQSNPQARAPLSTFSPIAASSPRANTGSVLSSTARAKSAFRNVSMGTTSGGIDAAISPPSSSHRPPSPIYSDAGSTVSLPEEFIRYRQHPYMAPEKLQIVKPMEGSMTLLKWKLLATPQLGGAKTFFSDASLPGVHKKAGQTSEGSSFDLRQKSASTYDLSSASTTHYATGSLKRKHSKRDREKEGGIRTKAGGDLDVSVGTESGMNAMTELLPQAGKDRQSTSAIGSPSTGTFRVASPRLQKVREGGGEPQGSLQQPGGSEGGGSSSLLQQVGSFLGFSRFSRQAEPKPAQGGSSHSNSRREGEMSGDMDSSDVGLAGLL